MAKGPGAKEVRKIQLTGGVTYTLSLPKNWVSQNGLSSSDGVVIDWRPSGALRLTPATVMKEVRRRVRVNVEVVPAGALYDHLIGAYLAGADAIEIVSKDAMSRTIQRTIRNFMRAARGFEIAEEEERRVVLLSLLSPSEMPLRASINRMYQQLTSIMRDIYDVLTGGDIELLEDHVDREREIDAMRLLVERQVASLLDSYKVAEALEMERREAVEYANLSRTLERMADHANNIANLILSTEKIPNLANDEAPLSIIPMWQSALRSLMVNLREHDASSIDQARGTLKQAQLELEKHEEGLWGGRASATPLLFDSRLSESVRRLCAYARDFGEILLNIMLHSSMFDE